MFRRAFWIVVAVLAPSVQAQNCQWSHVANGPPATRAAAAMAFDAARARAVLFGGSGNGGTFLRDTWLWDGAAWTLAATGGPGARAGAAATYDAGRGVVVLFGGYDASNRFRDTWTWNGASWLLAATSGPGGRSGMAMAYDASRQRVVLFGGYDGVNVLNDTWEWDGVSWTQRLVPTPSQRGWAAMAYDAGARRVVMHGGRSADFNPLSDTWAWDGAAWTSLSTTGPARSSHAMVYDTTRGRLVMQGGLATSGAVGDTFEWTGSAWAQQPDSGPANWDAAMVYDAARLEVVRFGGGFTNVFTDSTDLRACPASIAGQWSQPFSLPLIAIHSALLPTGKVLLFSAEHGVPGIHGWVLDPQTLALTEVAPPAGWNPDCAGHSFLGDGRLLVAGGTLGFNPTRGPRDSYLFNPWAVGNGNPWTRIADMRQGRWYPTNITLGDGRVVTMSGLNDTNGAINPDIEIWNPATPNAGWALVGQRAVPYYPYLHLLPNGLVFRSGPDRQTEAFNPANAQWMTVAPTIATSRFEAPSVLLPPTLTRVMLVGGYAGGSAQPTHSAEIIDLAAPAPVWRGTAAMTFNRFEHNAVILPDGKVLVIGGRSDNDSTPTPVLTPELFDPATETWSMMAPHQVPRRYHSTAILLPDGRVLAAGGDFQPSGEIYSPSYLFRGPRPAITLVKGAIGYGGTFRLGFTSATPNSNTVVLMRPSAVTHSVNMDQRYVRLAEGVASGTSMIGGPTSANLAPPGYYMLFVIDANGVPSPSVMVRVPGLSVAAARPR